MKLKINCLILLNMCKIIKKYYINDITKIQLIEINDLDRINTKLVSSIEELESVNLNALEYKRRIAQES